MGHLRWQKWFLHCNGLKRIKKINYCSLVLASLNKQNLKIYINICDIEKVQVLKIYASFCNDPSQQCDTLDGMH